MASSKKKSSAKKAPKATKNEKPTPAIVKEVVEDIKDRATAEERHETKPTDKLYRWNKWLAIIHALQGLAILVVSDNRLFSVTTNYLTPNPLNENQGLVVGTNQLFDVSGAWLIATFFFIAAAAHLAMATFYRNRYEVELSKGVNRLRWLEYSLSASVMLVAIGLLSGMYDLGSLVMLFALGVIMSLTGLAMEMYNQGKSRPNWLAYGIGCIAGIVPWLVFGIYAIGAAIIGDGHVPGFVYWIYATMFVLFSSFAVNMYLQYKGIGKWSNYIFGEQGYMVLSLAAKTILAWQIFVGILRP